MAAYTLSTLGATDPATPNPSKPRNTFANAAVREAFRPRDLSLAREPDFVDRVPGNRSQRLDHLAAKAVDDLGQSALQHWLSQASQAENPDERQAALAIAAEIARLAGIPFEEPYKRDAA